MAIRLLPFRQYAEQDVVNLYAVLPTGTNSMDTPFINGGNDAGVLVTVSNGNMSQDPVSYDGNQIMENGQNYLGKTDYPFVGRDKYPSVTLQVSEANSTNTALGVTLRQTLTHDENGEKLIYYPQKAIEMQAVISGQAVPVLSRGIITLDNADAFDGTTSVGAAVYGSNVVAGKLSTSALGSKVGTVIATGQRVNRGVSPDYFAGASLGTGAATTAGGYTVVQLNCQ
jgi:hypothetical protein